MTRHVRILLVGVLLLIILSSCVPRYTCKEAPLACTSCRTIALSFKPVPANIIVRALPLECRTILNDFDVIKVKTSNNPVSDMQKMVSLYRNYSEYLIILEGSKKTCVLKLSKQKDDVLKDSEKYCKKFSMIYDKTRSVCIPDPELQ